MLNKQELWLLTNSLQQHLGISPSSAKKIPSASFELPQYIGGVLAGQDNEEEARDGDVGINNTAEENDEESREDVNGNYVADNAGEGNDEVGGDGDVGVNKAGEEKEENSRDDVDGNDEASNADKGEKEGGDKGDVIQRWNVQCKTQSKNDKRKLNQRRNRKQEVFYFMTSTVSRVTTPQRIVSIEVSN